MVQIRPIKRMFPTVPIKRTHPILGMSETDNTEKESKVKEE